MASILCSNCNEGIHYHSNPSGIQYIFISKSDWDKICGSSFQRSPLLKACSGYPKLYRSDTIEEDFETEIHRLWRCPNCGSIIIFDSKGRKKKTYVKTEPMDMGKQIGEGLFFDDFLWDQLTEAAKPDSQLKSTAPSGYAKVYERGVVISQEKGFSHPVLYGEG